VLDSDMAAFILPAGIKCSRHAAADDAISPGESSWRKRSVSFKVYQQRNQSRTIERST